MQTIPTGTSSMIQLIIYYNNQTFSFPVDKTLSVSVIISNLFNSFALDPTLYEVKYQNKIIKKTDNRQLSKLLGNDLINPCFAINSKTIMTNVGKELINASTIVSITNIISIDDIKNNISAFFVNIKAKNNSKIISQSANAVKISFPSAQIANDFISYMNYIKTMNPLYKKMRIEIAQNVNNDYTNRTNITKQKTHFHSNTSASPIKANKSNNLLARSFDAIHSQNNAPLLNPVVQRQNKKMITNFYSNQEYIRNASPYISEEEKRLQEYIQDKKNWIDKKGFVSSVGHYSFHPNYIKNYVQLTPSESPLNHKFRDVQKSKWITEKGFC